MTSASAGLFPEPELVALYRKLIAATRRVQHAQKRNAAAGAEPAVRYEPAAGAQPDMTPTDGGGAAPDPR